MREAANGTQSRAGGVLESLRGSWRNLLSLARTRLELLANDVEEQREFLLRELLFGLVAVFCLYLGLACIVAFLVLLSWYIWRDLGATVLMTAGLALAFLAAAVVMLRVMRAAGRDRPRIFSTTLEELTKDRDSVQ